MQAVRDCLQELFPLSLLLFLSFLANYSTKLSYRPAKIYIVFKPKTFVFFLYLFLPFFLIFPIIKKNVIITNI